MPTTHENAIRADIVATARTLLAKNLIKGTSGNVSAQHEDGFLITPTGLPYDELTPDKIVRMNWDGVCESNLLPSSEWRFHREILLSSPHFNAVVHTHSPYATAVAVLGRDIPAIHYRIAVAGGSTIPCVRYATFGTQALADEVLEVMKNRRGCLLAHHGAVAAHGTLAGALNVAQVIEEMAELYILSSSVAPPPVLSDEDIAIVLDKHKTYGQQPARL